MPKVYTILFKNLKTSLCPGERKLAVIFKRVEGAGIYRHPGSHPLPRIEKIFEK